MADLKGARAFATPFLLIPTLAVVPVAGQEDDVAGHLRTARQELEVTNGALGGPGARTLVDRARAARFTVIGEEHGLAQVSMFVGALYDTLGDLDPAPRLAVENGPWVVEALNDPPLCGSAEAMAAMVGRHPAALAFSDDPELRLYARVTAPCAGELLWGLDQPFGATHVLEWVHGSAPRLAAEIEPLLARARRLDLGTGSSRYLYDGRPSEELSEVAQRLEEEGYDEEAAMVHDLVASARIYDDHRAAVEGADTGLRSNSIRERDMKRQFIERYREAEVREGAPVQVMVKMGADHLYRGIGPTGVATLGNFLHELAIAEGGRSLHVAIFPRVDPAALADGPASWAVPLMTAGFEDRWTLMDLGPVRAALHAGDVGAVSPEIRRLIFGYDLLVLFPDPRPSPRTLTRDR